MQPWAAEREVDVELAQALIAEQFPHLASPVTAFGEGWDNSAFLVGDWVFRFPRRLLAVPLLEAECRHLPRLQSLPLAVPNPVLVGRPTARYPWPFAGYRLIPGHPAVAVGDEIRLRAAAPLGGFLRALHQTPPPEGIAGDNLGRLDVARRAPRLAEAGFADLIPPPPGDRPLRLCHGDLYSRHLLVDGGELVGVIDWGDLHLGDPAVDLMVAWSFLPPPARTSFAAAYGTINAETLQLARFRAADHTLALRAYAVDCHDRDLLAEADQALLHIRSE